MKRKRKKIKKGKEVYGNREEEEEGDIDEGERKY